MEKRAWIRACDTSACIEVWRGDSGIVSLRTTWAPENAMGVPEEEWHDFVAAVKAGRFD